MAFERLQETTGNGFPERLRAAMSLRGYSQRKLAEEVGASKQSVTNWTQGHNEPSLRHLRRISRVLGVPLAELLEGDRSGEGRAAELLQELAATPIRPAVQALTESAPDLLDLLSRAESYVRELEHASENRPRAG